MLSIQKAFWILSFTVTLLMCNIEAHEDNHPHQHRPQNRQPQFSHTHQGQGSPHSHGSPASAGHPHGPGPNHHTHPPPKLHQSRFVISNLWNGSLDTVSQASDKGGSQTVVTLQGTK